MRYRGEINSYQLKSRSSSRGIILHSGRLPVTTETRDAESHRTDADAKRDGFDDDGKLPKAAQYFFSTYNIRKCFQCSGMLIFGISYIYLFFVIGSRYLPRHLGQSPSRSSNGLKRDMSQDHTLPNLLLLEAQKSASTSVAEWLFSNGVCSAKTFPVEPKHYTKEPHFFDIHFSKGIYHYARRYEDCIFNSYDDLIMDATPNNLLYAERVHDAYSKVQGSQHSNLRMIIILREPVERELLLFNHKRSLFMKNQDHGSWYSDVAFDNGTLMNFEQYAGKQ